MQVDLIYKNRHGRYLFAIGLLDRFARRQFRPGTLVSCAPRLLGTASRP